MGRTSSNVSESTPATSVPTRFNDTSATCSSGRTICIIKHEPLFSIPNHIHKVFTQVILSLNEHTLIRGS